MSSQLRPLRILFVASEATPWIKTGGLADAVSGLARALADLGHDVRLLLPAYADVLTHNPQIEALGGTRLLVAPHQPGTPQSLFCQLRGISKRPGNPYQDAQGQDWPDNWQRFGDFARIATTIAADRAGLDWRPDIVHCHDWQTGLVPVLMMLQRVPATSVFTIHNLAYRGLFPAHALAALGLPAWLWHADALEFHQQLSFIKGGLVFADHLTTVSPTYAREIQTPEHGHGLDGLLRHRRHALHGILNGIDAEQWDPSADPAIAAPYSATRIAGKRRCKQALQTQLGLSVEPSAPLLGLVSRLVEQKGIDLILQILPELLSRGCQLAVLGSGDAALLARLKGAAAAHPQHISFTPGFNEALAHRIEAGADLFLMPSRFEPCGLNQMYSQRYGTVPVVHGTGGLADSVIDADAANGSGFVFRPATTEALLAAIDRALACFAQPRRWRTLQKAGMQRDFSWTHSANDYLSLYRRDALQSQSVPTAQGPASPGPP